MSFDALTIGGVLVALISGGFLVGVVTHNDRLRGSMQRATARGKAKEGSAPRPD
jgi:hypothetical protein